MTNTLAAISADPIGFLVAFGAGILSFLSPCVLPLVPGYLSMVTGLEAAELESATARRTPPSSAPRGEPTPDGHPTGGVTTATATATATQAPPRPPLAPLLRGILLFVAGFTVVFVALGAAASGLGHLIGSHKQLLATASGAVIILLGAVLILDALPAKAWAKLGARPASSVARVIGERRFDIRPSSLGTWAAPVMGMAFGFAWTPCIGPVLGAILGLAASTHTLAGGAGLLLAYSLGLGVPFVVAGLAFGRLTDLLARTRRWLPRLQAASGVLLVVFGILLITGKMSWVSSEIGDLMRRLGLGRLSVS